MNSFSFEPLTKDRFYTVLLLSLVVLAVQFVRFSVDRAGFSIDWKREAAHQAETTANKESCVCVKLNALRC